MTEIATGAELAERLLARLRRDWDAPALAYAVLPEQILGGNATFIYGFELEGAPPGRDGPLILRLFRADQRVDWVRAEAVAQRTVAELGYPAPRVLLACTDAAVLGAPLMVMRRVPGHALLAGLTPTRSQAMRVSVARMLLAAPGRLAAIPRVVAEWQSRLHALDPEPLRRAAEEERIPLHLLGLERELERIERNLHGAPEPVRQELAAGVDWIRRNRPTVSGAPSICHGDFHPLNVLVKDGAVSGVIDWTDALIGPPAFDVAQTRFLFRFAPLRVPGALRGAATLAKRRLARDFLKQYHKRRPLELEGVDYYESLRLLRELVGVARERLIRAGRLPGSLRPSENPWDFAHQVDAMLARFEALSGVRVSLPPAPRPLPPRVDPADRA